MPMIGRLQLKSLYLFQFLIWSQAPAALWHGDINQVSLPVR
jgi:hypothetical protein